MWLTQLELMLAGGDSRAMLPRKPDSGHADTISITIRMRGPAGTQ